jgi:hypothetical protein
VNKTVSVCILVDFSWVSTIAGTTSLAVNNNLCVETDRCTAEIIKNVKSVSDGGCRTLSPA